LNVWVIAHGNFFLETICRYNLISGKASLVWDPSEILHLLFRQLFFHPGVNPAYTVPDPPVLFCLPFQRLSYCTARVLNVFQDDLCTCPGTFAIALLCLFQTDSWEYENLCHWLAGAIRAWFLLSRRLSLKMRNWNGAQGDLQVYAWTSDSF
jgi:hypothetical protein